MKHTNFAKKSLSAILALAMLLGILAMLPITVGAADTALATAEDPILIGSTTDLDSLSAKLAAAKAARAAEAQADTYYVEFTANIDYENAKLVHASLGSYSLHIDGKGHTVSNYKGNHGIFYIIGANSTIKDLHAVNAQISGSAAQMGAILGYTYGGLTMTGCSATGTVSNTRTTGTPCVGGLIGSLENGTYDHYIADCVSYVTVSVDLDSSYVGGIIGKAYAPHANITFETCENHGSINGKTYAGGILGGIESARSIKMTECVNEGAITGTTYAGGMLGYGKVTGSNEETYNFSQNLNKANVTATTYAGGIIGYATGKLLFKITSCGNEGTITTTGDSGTYTAGILAYANVTAVIGSRHWISGCYSMGTLAAATEACSGGILGRFEAVTGSMITLSECYDDTARDIEYPEECDHGLLAGTIVGCTKQLYFSRCYAVKKGDLVALAVSTITEPEKSMAVDTNTSTVYTDYSGKVASPFNVQMAKRQDNVLIRKPDGLGTEESPYMIGTAHEMMWVAASHGDFDNMTYLELTADINYGGRSISMDLMESDRGYVPKSIYFDGNNHTFSNYTSSAGIFMRVGKNSTVKNFHVADATILYNSSSNRHAGGIVGMAYAGFTMINCSTDENTTVTMQKSDQAVGGLVGSIETTPTSFLIVDCHNAAKVVGTYDAGGVIGSLSTTDNTTDLSIMGCTNSGSVTSSSAVATDNYTRGIGGILGYVFRGDSVQIYNCKNTGAIQATSTTPVGGILGATSHNSSSPVTLTMQNCRNEGAITSAGTYAGGIVGYGSVATSTPKTWKITACANVGTVSGATNNAGIIAAASEKVTLTIANSYSTSAAILGVASANVTQTNCYTGTSVPDDLKAANEMPLAIAPSAKNLWVRVKITDNFGLMAITNVADGKKLSDYQEVGFYFVESDTTPLPSDVIKAANKVEGAAYNGSETKFAAAYQDMLAVNFDRNLHFVAYAIDQYGNEVYSDMRTLNVESLIEQLAEGYNGLVKNPYEIALYQQMLNYGEAYDKFEGFDLSIGNLNLAQDNYRKDYSNNIDSSVANVQNNLDGYANTMYDLGLDVMGLNEVNLYRGLDGKGDSYGGFNVPWEIAQRMEEKTGENYYWAFASALDSSATNSAGKSIRHFYNAYANETDPDKKPDGRWHSNDGDLSAPTTAGYGEGIVSKYPIVGYEAVYFSPIDYLRSVTVPAQGKNETAEAYNARVEAYNAAVTKYAAYDENFQYDPDTGYERRVILVVQLDVNGEIVTVMVSHFDHQEGYSSYSLINAFTKDAAVAKVQELVNSSKYANTPIFLTGDLNIQRHSVHVFNLEQALNRSGMDNITTTHDNGSKIDYVFYGKYTELLEYGVDTKNISSDHRPVYARVRIKRADFR